MQYGNSSFDGSTGIIAFSAKAPCPISRLPGPRDGLASPTEYAGKLYWCIYLLDVWVSIPSNSCSSLTIPNVAIDITCVKPLVNKLLPWTLGSNPTSQDNGLISSKALPSTRVWS